MSLKEKEVREGYKMTELGEIPVEWEISKLGEITIEHRQGYYSKEKYTSSGTKIVRITDLKNPKINFELMPKMVVNEKDLNNYAIKKGDFLFARSGAIGRYGIVEEHETAVFASYLIRFRFDKDVVINNYLGLFYESNFCINQIKKITQGSSNININAGNIKAISIPLPPLPEQQKIAEILSTVDEQLETIEGLIEKTKELKKGLMQRLLTKGIGHTEFKQTELGEIPVGWDLFQLNEVTSYVDYRGKTPKKSLKGIKLLTAKNIKKGYIDYNISKEYIDERIYEEVMKRGKPQIGDVIFTTEAPLGNVAQINDANVALAQRVIKFSSEKKLTNHYLKYYFLSEIFQTQLLKKATGSTVKGIQGKQLHKLLVVTPPLPEQQKIASILSSVDEQIDTYEQEKEKVTELKKGLMQQLLTGKVRVTV